MILLRVLSTSEQQVEEVARLLLKERLVIDANIKRHIDRLVYADDNVSTVRVYLLTAKTKGLLFPAIDNLLREHYPHTMPEIYSLPIVHMDWEQSNQLVEVLKPV